MRRLAALQSPPLEALTMLLNGIEGDVEAGEDEEVLEEMVELAIK